MSSDANNIRLLNLHLKKKTKQFDKNFFINTLTLLLLGESLFLDAEAFLALLPLFAGSRLPRNFFLDVFGDALAENFSYLASSSGLFRMACTFLVELNKFLTDKFYSIGPAFKLLELNGVEVKVIVLTFFRSICNENFTVREVLQAQDGLAC